MTARGTTIPSGRDAYRQEMQTREAQQNGEMPADLDEDGNEINPHIPQYMSNTPWYADYGHKTLKHQKKIPTKSERLHSDGMDKWYQKGQAGPAATRYRKGACENCGAMTHKKKDCVERPRKTGARFTGKDIKADEVVVDVNLGFEGKRDRWNGVVIEDVQQEVRAKHALIDAKRAEVVARKTRLVFMQKQDVTEPQLQDAEKLVNRRVHSAGVGGAAITRDTIVHHKAAVLAEVARLKTLAPPRAATPPPSDGAGAAAGEEAGGSPQGKRALAEWEKLDGALEVLLTLIPASEGGTANDEEFAKLYAAQDGATEEDELEAEDVGGGGGGTALAAKVDTGGVRDGVEQKVTARNLRIREDTAKYLRNLSTDPAYYYDGKTRSMRGNPYPDQAPDEVDYAGDNWVKSTGDALQVDKMQLFCWDATRRLQDGGHEGKYLSLQANPTQAERAFRQDAATKDTLREKKENSLLSAYGGSEFLKPMPDELRYASENFVEYRQDGTVLKGAEEATAQSRYPEDVYRNGHTTVWGSHWSAGQWGYRCCKSTVRNSLCTAKRGGGGAVVAAAAAAAAGGEGAETEAAAAEDAAARAEAEAMRKELAALEAQMVADSAPKEADEGEAERLRRSKREEERMCRKRKACLDELMGHQGTRKLTAEDLQNMGNGVTISEADMAAYKRQRLDPEDPMAKFIEEEDERERSGK